MKKILFAFAIAISTVLWSCSGASGFKNGQKVTVKEKCIWASNEETFSQMNDYCSRRDEGGLEIMESRGQIGILYTGDTGVVTDMGIGKVRIRLDNSMEVWVSSEFLR